MSVENENQRSVVDRTLFNKLLAQFAINQERATEATEEGTRISREMRVDDQEKEKKESRKEGMVGGVLKTVLGSRLSSIGGMIKDQISAIPLLGDLVVDATETALEIRKQNALKEKAMEATMLEAYAENAEMEQKKAEELLEKQASINTQAFDAAEMYNTSIENEMKLLITRESLLDKQKAIEDEIAKAKDIAQLNKLKQDKAALAEELKKLDEVTNRYRGMSPEEKESVGSLRDIPSPRPGEYSSANTNLIIDRILNPVSIDKDKENNTVTAIIPNSDLEQITDAITESNGSGGEDEEIARQEALLERLDANREATLRAAEENADAQAENADRVIEANQETAEQTTEDINADAWVRTKMMAVLTMLAPMLGYVALGVLITAAIGSLIYFWQPIKEFLVGKLTDAMEYIFSGQFSRDVIDGVVNGFNAAMEWFTGGTMMKDMGDVLAKALDWLYEKFLELLSGLGVDSATEELDRRRAEKEAAAIAANQQAVKTQLEKQQTEQKQSDAKADTLRRKSAENKTAGAQAAQSPTIVQTTTNAVNKSTTNNNGLRTARIQQSYKDAALRGAS